MQEQERDSEEKKSLWRTLFDDLSVAQLLAGALAAVTSMFLASRIGIAGSLIGAAVGSIVSAVASQVYKKFLSASAEKIKDLAPGHDGASEQADGGAKGAAGQETVPFAPVASMQTIVIGGPADETAAIAPTAGEDAAEDPSDKTAVIDAPKTAAISDTPARSPESQAYAEAALSRARSARERKAQIQKRAIIVAALSALLAVVLSAVVIEVVTAGQGVGTKPPSLSATWSAPKDVVEEPAVPTGGQGGASTSQNQQAQSGGTAQNGASDQGKTSSGSVAIAPDANSSSSDGSNGGAASGDSESSDSSNSAAGGQGVTTPSQPDPNTGSGGSDTGSGSDGSSAGSNAGSTGGSSTGAGQGGESGSGSSSSSTGSAS